MRRVFYCSYLCVKRFLRVQKQNIGWEEVENVGHVSLRMSFCAEDETNIQSYRIVFGQTRSPHDVDVLNFGRLRGRREHVQLMFATEKAEDRRLHGPYILDLWENVLKVSGCWRWELGEEGKIFILERDIERRCHAVRASSPSMHNERCSSCTMRGQWLVLGYAASYMIRKSVERSMSSLLAVFRWCFRNFSRLSFSSSEPLRLLTTWPSRNCSLEISLF